MMLRHATPARAATVIASSLFAKCLLRLESSVGELQTTFSGKRCVGDERGVGERALPTALPQVI
jgi:hypothetical protein